MEFKGIDISEYQAKVDFGQIKANGIEFVMIRTGYGRGPDGADKSLYEHAAEAARAGLPYGFYHYSYALTPDDARAEAEFALGLVKGMRPSMPFAYDVEDASQRDIPPDEMDAIADAFLSRVAEAGYYPMLYSNLRKLSTGFTPGFLAHCDIWLAQWASEPTYGGSFGMWQYTASGRVPGIDTVVDLDIAYRDYPSLISGMGPSEPSPEPDNTPSPYAASAVEKAVSLGILRGNGKGDLMLRSPLSRQDFCVLMDRLGLLDG